MKNEAQYLSRTVLNVICYTICASGLKFGIRKREG
jgi:hypothetical protein